MAKILVMTDNEGNIQTCAAFFGARMPAPPEGYQAFNFDRPRKAGVDVTDEKIVADWRVNNGKLEKGTP